MTNSCRRGKRFLSSCCSKLRGPQEEQRLGEKSSSPSDLLKRIKSDGIDIGQDGAKQRDRVSSDGTGSGPIIRSKDSKERNPHETTAVDLELCSLP